jgi:hypothetical protein
MIFLGCNENLLSLPQLFQMLSAEGHGLRACPELSL